MEIFCCSTCFCGFCLIVLLIQVGLEVSSILLLSTLSLLIFAGSPIWQGAPAHLVLKSVLVLQAAHGLQAVPSCLCGGPVSSCFLELLLDIPTVSEFLCPSINEEENLHFLLTVKSFSWSIIRDTNFTPLCTWSYPWYYLLPTESYSDQKGFYWDWLIVFLFASVQFSRLYLNSSVDSKKQILP